MERIAAGARRQPVQVRVSRPTPIAARQLLRLEHATLGYGERRRSSPTSTGRSLAGERIGLLGPNGAGKSTLLKRDRRRARAALRARGCAAQGLRIGYFAQHQVEQLRPDRDTAVASRGSSSPDTREQELRDFPRRLRLSRRPRTRAASRASPAARRRGSTLALLVRQRPNLLLLDEPTNHLDIEMREALTEALQDYEGALVVVAHDRHLLRATTDELWLVADGAVRPLRRRSRRLSRLGARPGAGARTDDRAAGSAPHRPIAARRSAPRPRPGSAYRTRASRCRRSSHASKRELEALAAEKRELDAWLAAPEAYAENKERLKTALARQGDLAGSWRASKRSGWSCTTRSNASAHDLEPSIRRTRQPGGVQLRNRTNLDALPRR